MGYREEAEKFEKEETAFHLGFLPTEQSNSLTAHLDKEFAAGTEKGVRNLQSVDWNVLKMAEKVLRSDNFAELISVGYRTVVNGGRIIFSGCGATGRLSILLEAMWRDCCRRNDFERYSDHVQSIMTGGDYALVKSVESFEDYAVFGARQVRDMKMTANDLLVAITEGGETSSVLGTVSEATRLGCRAFLLFNNPAGLLAEHLERSREAINNPAVTVLDLACGPMALAGSTRMQATTSEQLVASCALESIFHRLSGISAADVDYAAAFRDLLTQLSAPGAVAGMAQYIDFEADIYRQGGRVTYFADLYMLDIFTDTTERSPTFMLPGFKRIDDTVSPEPWAFARNPLYVSEAAMRAALGRDVRCLNWQEADYRDMDAGEKIIGNMPKISAADLVKIPVGNEALPSRYATGHDAAVLFGYGRFPEALSGAYAAQSAKFAVKNALCIGAEPGAGYVGVPFTPAESCMLIFEHMGVKLALNTISTGTMVQLGRVSGNWMSFVAVSNKKLIDRAIRLIVELAGIDYHTACLELFKSMEEMPDKGQSAVQYTLSRLTK